MNLSALQSRIRAVDPVMRTGRVRSIHPTHIIADGPNVALGALCRVDGRVEDGSAGAFEAEVVSVDRDSITLSPFDERVPTFAGAKVVATAQANRVPVGQAFLGRVVDALGRPADGLGALAVDQWHPLYGTPTDPLDRVSPATPLDTGIRSIDGLLTLGVGQRVGIFAASGVGKSSLMTQIVQQADVDVTILCLVGERGREVEALWNTSLTAEARARSTLVSATSDQSASMRVRAGHYALALADYWRAEGKHVLLVIDSVTRLAMAMRERGLAAGEPPTVRGYTPSVLSTIPKLVERCGALRRGGSITAIMTILSETDDIDDPVSEMMKSLLDGHILLSRGLAEQGHFPAIDVPRSISRSAEGVIADGHLEQARQVVEWLSVHNGSRTLIDAGLHVRGANTVLDRAIDRHPEIVAFLRQRRDEFVAPTEARAALGRLVGRTGR